MRKTLEIGGFIAGAVLVIFGVVALVMGVNGRSTVQNSLKQEQIVGTPDMSPSLIAGEVAADKAAQAKLVLQMKQAGVTITPSRITTPSCSVAGKAITSGSTARCFAEYMRIHTFAATGGLVYSQMGLYQALPNAPLKQTDGVGGTSVAQYAAIDPVTKQPVSNGRRDTWVTYTALTSALNSSYMASQLALFAIVVGVALLLTGIGFLILAAGGVLRRPSEPAKLSPDRVKPAPVGHTPVATA